MAKKQKMNFKILTLYPQIFESFLNTSLVARGLSKNIIQIETINWREKYGVGNHKQVDDKPFGGGSSMVLQADPVFRALNDLKAVSPLFKESTKEIEHKRIIPPNSNFENFKKLNPKYKKVTISLTPRGFDINQNIIEWLAKDFDEMTILCGRFEGFDARVSEAVDLELSLGNFVLNGGEVAAMAILEAVSRLRPGFIVKDTSALHDSFSSELNFYSEQKEFINSRNTSKKNRIEFKEKNNKNQILFDDKLWLKNILPFIEHPQYTRPEIWKNIKTPKILLSGNHHKIQEWRINWFTQDPML